MASTLTLSGSDHPQPPDKGFKLRGTPGAWADTSCTWLPHLQLKTACVWKGTPAMVLISHTFCVNSLRAQASILTYIYYIVYMLCECVCTYIRVCVCVCV